MQRGTRQMKLLSKTILISMAMINLSCETKGASPLKENPKKDVNFEKTSIQSKESVNTDHVLGNYVLLMMNIVNTNASFAKKNVIARSIVNVSNDIFSSLEEKKHFVTMIAIESKFNTDAVSSAGAVGLTQVIPKYAKEFAERCGMNDVRPEDLKNPDINLLVGACRFKALLDNFNGNTAAALVAYNAGLASDQLKQLKSLKNITNVESSSYVVKWLYLKDKADAQMKKVSEE